MLLTCFNDAWFSRRFQIFVQGDLFPVYTCSSTLGSCIQLFLAIVVIGEFSFARKKHSQVTRINDAANNFFREAR